MKTRFLFCCFTLFILMTGVSQAAKQDSPLYNLSFSSLDGQPVPLSNYKGKVVLLNFWATWCPPCIKEMPSMQHLYETFKGQPFEIVAINAGESETTVESFLLELDTELTFPILLDESSRSFRELGIRALPMSFIFDPQGKLVQTITGGREWNDPKEVRFIKSLLEQKD
ncbi:MAG: TlpA disulfide reductase family protein [Pontibacterium sp.]